jgi:hypothetical protein
MPQPKLSPKYFFLSIASLTALITSVVSFLNLVFETLNQRFPDVLNATYQYGYTSYNYDAMRSALATLIIAFPIYIAVTYFWNKEKSLGSVDTVIRKWMLYLILFLAGAVIVGDLITLVRYFIAGEVTTRFIVKVVVALAVALKVGVYHIFLLQERKKVWGFAIMPWSAIMASVLVILAISWSFMVMGSPMKQRLLRLDDRRIQDLQSIQWQVINYWQQKEKLPAKLSDLVDPISGYSLPVDPEFEKGLSYEYMAKDQTKFELCATFALPIPKGWQENNYGVKPYPLGMGGDSTVSYPYPGGGTNESWAHEAGRTCFERTIDPELYPPFKSIKG